RMRPFLLVALASILSSMGAACQFTSKPELLTMELLLTVEQLPPNWEVAVPPLPMGPQISFGDEDDSYISFKPNGVDTNTAKHYVLYYRNHQKAEDAYRKLSRSRFNSNSIAISRPWEEVPELADTSMQSDQFLVACAI